MTETPCQPLLEYGAEAHTALVDTLTRPRNVSLKPIGAPRGWRPRNTSDPDRNPRPALLRNHLCFLQPLVSRLFGRHGRMPTRLAYDATTRIAIRFFASSNNFVTVAGTSTPCISRALQNTLACVRSGVCVNVRILSFLVTPPQVGASRVQHRHTKSTVLIPSYNPQCTNAKTHIKSRAQHNISACNAGGKERKYCNRPPLVCQGDTTRIRRPPRTIPQHKFELFLSLAETTPIHSFAKTQ